MDNKITIQNLSEALAQSKGLKANKAEAFVRAVFDVIATNVVSDGLVKVKGLGTFKLIDVLQRESVDVTTGKRIVIPGHTKITFTPDSTLRDQINRPFADFQTVVLNDDTDTKEMERIDSVEALLITDEQPDDSELVFTDTQEKAEEKDELMQESQHDASTIDTEEVTTPPAVDHPEDTTPQLTETTESTDSANDISQDAPSEEEVNTDDIIDSESESEEIVEEQNVVASEELPVADSLNEMHSDVPLQPDAITETSSKETIHLAGSVNSEVPACTKDSSTIWFYLFYILLTLVLMTASYFLGYFKVLCPCEKEEAPTTEVVAEEKVDSIIQKTEPKQPMPHELYPQVPGGKYLIIGTRKVREMKVGDNLFKIAREEYGDKEFAQYIIVYNQFTNPDVISKGYPIKLPELQEVK